MVRGVTHLYGHYLITGIKKVHEVVGFIHFLFLWGLLFGCFVFGGAQG